MLIAGIPEDHVFVHVCYIAGHLSRMLPKFQYKKICKQREEWKVGNYYLLIHRHVIVHSISSIAQVWLKNFCKSHSWFHTSSPLIWREIGKSSRNATYVGGATQFWEFIYEYYGVESHLTKRELLSLKQDFVQVYRFL